MKVDTCYSGHLNLVSSKHKLTNNYGLRGWMCVTMDDLMLLSQVSMKTYAMIYLATYDVGRGESHNSESQTQLYACEIVSVLNWIKC